MKFLPLQVGRICENPSCFFESKKENEIWGEELNNKIYNISKTKLEANIVQITKKHSSERERERDYF